MEIRRAVQTGRILFLPVDKCDLFAEEFLSYIGEGFCPVSHDVADGKHLWDFLGYEVSDDGVVITASDTDLYTLPYKASQSGGSGSDTYTVTFKIAGDTCLCEAGTVVTTLSVNKGESLTLPDQGECGMGEGEGAAWYLSESQEEEGRVGDAGESYTPIADTTLYSSCPSE